MEDDEDEEREGRLRRAKGNLSPIPPKLKFYFRPFDSGVVRTILNALLDNCPTQQTKIFLSNEWWKWFELWVSQCPCVFVADPSNVVHKLVVCVPTRWWTTEARDPPTAYDQDIQLDHPQMLVRGAATRLPGVPNIFDCLIRVDYGQDLFIAVWFAILSELIAAVVRGHAGKKHESNPELSQMSQMVGVVS